MSKRIFLDGKFVDHDDARISVFDHGYLYGDGVFEGIRAYSGRIFRLQAHVDRLFSSAKTLMLQIPYTKEKMTELIVEACRVNGLQDAYIRVVVSRGAGDLGLDPTKCPKPTVVVIADSIALYPESLYRSGLTVCTSSIRRQRAEALNPQIKSLNYLNSILAKIEANQRGCQEVVMLSEEGFVAECSADNIFIVRGRKLLTPAPHLGILLGITRDAVMDVARAAGYDVVETTFTRHEMWNADEVFLTGTAAEIVSVVSIDERVVGNGKPGPVAAELQAAFRELAKRDGAAI
ncbi:MAG: branched-chain-amino-acid transaminase [Thermaerobacter sp.]|nr:branched-chain-amino-acid transaminase [Thermaerobacter sp.]